MFQRSITRRARAHKLIPLALLLSTGAFLGISTNLAKLAADAGLTPLSFLTWSVLGAAIVLGSVQLMRSDLPRLNQRSLEYFLVAGFITTATPQLLFFAAVPRVGASFVALAITFPPLFTYLGALLLGMEGFEARRAAGVLLALMGAGVLAIYKLSAPDANAFWITATLIGPLILAAGNLYRTARWPENATAPQLAPGMLAAGAVFLFLAAALAALFPNASADFSLAVPTNSLTPILLIFVQIVVFAAQNLLFFMLQERGGPVYLSLIGSVGAVVGVPIAVLLGEAWPQGLLLGGLLVAAGIGFLTFGNAKVSNASVKGAETN